MTTVRAHVPLFVIPAHPDGTETRPSASGAAYAAECDLVHVNHAVVRRLRCERGPLYRKKASIAPIRSVDLATGEALLYGPGDAMPVHGGDPLRLAVQMALLHALGWSDADEAPGDGAPTRLSFVYSSLLLAFEADGAAVYNQLEEPGDACLALKERLAASALHYLRDNYWVCRVRCCDQVGGRWVDCSAPEAYALAHRAARHAVQLRGAIVAELRTPPARYTPALLALPETPDRRCAVEIFGAQLLETVAAPHCSRRAAPLIAAARRANAEASAALARPWTGRLVAPGPVRPSGASQHERLAAAAAAMTQVGAVKQSGAPVRAPGDQSGYAASWENIMQTYNEVEVGDERARAICKELLLRGYAPLTLADKVRAP